MKTIDEGNLINKYRYSISVGNPEGTDWSINFMCDKKYTDKQFQDFAEAAFVYALEGLKKDKEVVHIANFNTADKVVEYMKYKGFESVSDAIAEYYIDPYWGKESIKNRELLKLINKEHD